MAADVNYRINGTQELLLKSTAAVLDVIGFFLAITVVGDAATEGLDIVADPLFFLWFGMLGANYMGRNASSKLTTMIAGSVLKLLPLLNALPGYSLEVWRMVAIMKREDEERTAELAKEADAKTKQMLARTMQIRARQASELKRVANEQAALDAEAA